VSLRIRIAGIVAVSRDGYSLAVFPLLRVFGTKEEDGLTQREGHTEPIGLSRSKENQCPIGRTAFTTLFGNTRSGFPLSMVYTVTVEGENEKQIITFFYTNNNNKIIWDGSLIFYFI
jgi:hypothetical protein